MPGFLRLCLCRCVCVYVCVCVCVCVSTPPRLFITSSVMWHDMHPTSVVKQLTCYMETVVSVVYYYVIML